MPQRLCFGLRSSCSLLAPFPLSHFSHDGFAALRRELQQECTMVCRFDPRHRSVRACEVRKGGKDKIECDMIKKTFTKPLVSNVRIHLDLDGDVSPRPAAMMASPSLAAILVSQPHLPPPGLAPLGPISVDMAVRRQHQEWVDASRRKKLRRRQRQQDAAASQLAAAGSEGEGAAASPEDLARRLRKRLNAIEAVKRTPEYKDAYVYDGGSLPTTPDPTDLTITKRGWESSVIKWRAMLKRLSDLH